MPLYFSIVTIIHDNLIDFYCRNVKMFLIVNFRSFVNPVFFLTFKNYAKLFFDDKVTSRHMYEYYNRYSVGDTVRYFL